MRRALLVGVVAGVVALAAPEGKSRLQIEMQKLAAGMDLIQKGILYNCRECLEDGADRILKDIKALQRVEVKHFLPENQKYAYKFVQKTGSLIEMYAKDIKEAFAAGNMEDVINDHSQILRQCTSCHTRIRGW